MSDENKMKATSVKVYEVFLRDRESQCIYADDYDQVDGDLFFWGKDGKCVAWFNQADVIGWVEGHEMIIHEEVKKK